MHSELFRTRQDKVFTWLKKQGIAGAALTHPANLRYFSGHPSDAILFFLAEGTSILLAWDISMAEAMATADQIRPWNEYGRTLTGALPKICSEGGLSGNFHFES